MIKVKVVICNARLTSKDTEIAFSKKVLPELPKEYHETGLGDPMGAKNQFRTVDGMHAREYSDRFVIHKDSEDPRSNPVGHLVRDSPESLAALAMSAYFSRINTRPKASETEKRPVSLFGFLLIFLTLNSFLRRLKRIIF